MLYISTHQDLCRVFYEILESDKVGTFRQASLPGSIPSFWSDRSFEMSVDLKEHFVDVDAQHGTVALVGASKTTLGVPLEIWIHIFRVLKKRTKDIKSIRQACRTFDYAASPFLVPNVYFSYCQRDLARLEEIANHPVFSRYVTSLVYDSRLYEESLAHSKQDYFRGIDFELKGQTSWIIEITRLGYRKYNLAVERQQQLRNSASAFLNLSQSVSSMPQLHEVKVVGDMNWRRPFRSDDTSTDRRSNGERILLPRVASILTMTNPSKAEEHAVMWRQTMVDFFQTLYEPRIARQLRIIKTVGIQAPVQFWNELTVALPYPSFNIKGANVEFERLEELYLTIGSGCRDDSADTWNQLWPHNPSPEAQEMLSCRLGRIFSAAQHLQVLLLEFNPVGLEAGDGLNVYEMFGM